MGKSTLTCARSAIQALRRPPAELVCLALSLCALNSGPAGRAAESLPPLITTAATSTLDSGGRPWGYLTFGENRPGLIAARSLAVYAKSGAPDSTAPFKFNGVVAPVRDATAIQVMLNRGAKVGDNLAALEAQLIALHGSLLNGGGTNAVVNPPSMPLAQRLAALLNRAAGDTALAQLLDLYALSHPGLRLVRGTAWAGPLNVAALGTPVTLEVRERDASGRDAAVIGRVTLQAGQADPLPALGPIVVVPDPTARGDMNVKLRWATPDALRHAGTKHQGDLVWRVSRAFAETHGLNGTTPTGSALDGLALSNPADVKRLTGPVFPSKLFSSADVADFSADATTSYASDNNERYSASGTTLPEGAQFYYFAAAADALGRPGLASPGVLATFCARLAPPVPTRLGVVNQGTQLSGNYLDVHWQSNTDGTPTTRYELFRGDDLSQLAAAQRGELNLDATPIIPALPNAIKRVGAINDPGAAAPQVLHLSDPADGVLGKTWWFAIRAIHDGPSECGSVASALSPPVFGMLRSGNSALPAWTNEVTPLTGECLRVGCISNAPAQAEVATESLGTSVLQFIARCDRRPGITAAHFRVVDPADNSEVVPETSVVYAEGDSTVELAWTRPLALLSRPLLVQCKAESLGQFTSDWALSQAAGVAPAANTRMAYHFLAGAISKSELPSVAGGDPLWTTMLFQPAQPWPADLHLVVSPATSQIFHPTFCVPLVPQTAQYRVYRRVADGPLTLIAQGLQNYAGPGCTLTIEDPAPPVANGQVHYFAQLLDEQGHGSVMRKLGRLRFTGDKPPVPVLFTPQGADFAGTLSAPAVTVSWVCPPEHVERFEVLYATAKPSNTPDQTLGSIAGSPIVLTRKSALPTVHKVTSKANALTRKLIRVEQSLLTGRVGGDFGPGPRFTLPLQVDPALRYTVWVRALGPGGEPSENSRSVEFQWQPPAPPASDIAWPARPLPPVAPFNNGITVVDFREIPTSRLIWGTAFVNGAVAIPEPSVSVDSTPIGIRVGSLNIDNDSAKHGFDSAAPFGPIFYTPATSTTFGKADPNQQVFTKDTDPTQHLFPAVLYRQQVTNSAFPGVSGDVIQCSPLIRSIAWLAPQVNAQINMAELADPFFRWVGPDLPSTPVLDLYLVDTQPVVIGATYRYWLTRFSSLGEPIQTVTCGQITVESP